MLSRSETGKLQLKTFILDVIAENYFDKCLDEVEIKWLSEQLKGCVGKAAQQKLDETNDEIGEIL